MKIIYIYIVSILVSFFTKFRNTEKLPIYSSLNMYHGKNKFPALCDDENVQKIKSTFFVEKEISKGVVNNPFFGYPLT